MCLLRDAWCVRALHTCEGPAFELVGSLAICQLLVAISAGMGWCVHFSAFSLCCVAGHFHMCTTSAISACLYGAIVCMFFIPGSVFSVAVSVGLLRGGAVFACC
jgi:hypothetical protein